jgi:beta-lactam-binding protein with PASTA domain
VAVGGWFIYELVSNRGAEEAIEQVEEGESFEVGNFKGSNFEEVTNNSVQKKRFNIKVEYVYSSDVEKGYIVDQSIAPGKTVKYGTEIIFKVSKGPEYVRVPAVDELTVEMATMELEGAGFVVVVAEKENTEGKNEGSVAGTDPGPGVSAVKGSTVTLYVWGAPKLGSGGLDILDWFF